MPVIDLGASGLPEWMDPATAGAAAAESQMRLQAAVIASRLKIQNMLWDEQSSAVSRQLKMHLAELKDTGILIASLLNAGKQW